MRTLTASFAPSAPLDTVREGGKSGAAGPLLLKVLAISILLPDEMGFLVQGLWFSIARIILLALTPVLVIRFGQLVAAGRYRFVFSDLLVPLTGFWMLLALGKMDGMQDAMNHAGPLALEYCVGYMAARFLLSEHGQAVSFINFLCWAIAFVALLGLADTLTHRFFLHDLTRALIGGKNLGDAGDRLGLLRATSTLEHPILFGFTCAVGLILAVSIPIRGPSFAIFACGLGTFLSLSSGAIQGAVFGLGLLLYNRMMAGIRFRWAAVMGMLAAGFMMLFMVTNHPFGVIFDYLTFDPETGYFRMYEWQTAGEALDQTPWFGVGWVIPDFYDIPFTIDSIWLLWALNFGIPGSALLGLSMLGATSLSTSGPRVHLTAAESKLGTILSIMIFLIIFLGFTVDFFGTAWILIPLLIGVRAHLGGLGRVSVRA